MLQMAEPEMPPIMNADEVAAWLARDERYASPEGREELEALWLLALEPPAFPERVGLVGGLFVDVMVGRRTNAAALASLAADGTVDTVPEEYGKTLNRIAFELLGRRRLRESRTLSHFLLTAVESAYGRECLLWVEVARSYIQSSTLGRGQTILEENLDVQPPDLTPVAEAMIAQARSLGDAELVATCLSAAGQYWWTTADRDGAPVEQLLRRAESALCEAASARSGADRGRTMATLAQIRSRLYQLGTIDAAQVISAAREAVRLVDRDARPVQWLRAALAAAELGDTSLTPDLKLGDIESIQDRHGAGVAGLALLIACQGLHLTRGASACAELLREGWAAIEPRAIESEDTRTRLLNLAAHTSDAGLTSCRDYGRAEADAAFKRLRRAPRDRRLAGGLHLALHCVEEAKVINWALREGPRQAGLDGGLRSLATIYAIGVIHGQQTPRGELPHPFRFRCAMLAAKSAGLLGLRQLTRAALTDALTLLAQWASQEQPLTDAAVHQRRHELEAILDACIREAIAITAALGSSGAEWILQSGRFIAGAARGSVTAAPALALAHSFGLKGAMTSDTIRFAGPLQETEQIGLLRRQVEELERAEREDVLSATEGSTPGADELRMSAWLHEREATSGSTRALQRRNMQARCDDELVRALVAARYRENDGFRALPTGAIQRALGKTTVLVDLFLGFGASQRATCYATVFSPSGVGYYLTNLQEVGGPVHDPDDPDGLLLLDGISQLVVSVRRRVQEDPGIRTVSRIGEEALAAAANDVLGRLHEDLDGLRAAGCDQLAICPHGPLTFLPFHLLPLGGAPLADDWLVSVVPSVGALLRNLESTADAPVHRGVIVSPGGGRQHGLPEEPRLLDQLEALQDLGPGGEALPPGCATPGNALALMERSRYVHIASHGSALGSAPAFHCLYLDSDRDSDGRLFALDVVHRDLRGVELVTLCACETALGRTDPAGNLRGLPAAMLGAGARAVVASLWPVSAAPAGRFFTTLHTELARGVKPLWAYRAAQQATKAGYPAMRDWGAYVYIGSWN